MALAGPEPLHAWILSTMPQALAYAVSLLRQRDLAEDVVHDCYCRLLQKAARYDLPRDGLKLLLRAITNAAIDLHRRSLPEPLNEVARESLLDRREPEAEAGAMARELEQAVAAGLARLPLEQRAALELKSLGHSLQDIADTLGVSASNAGVLIHRGRQALALLLAPHLEDTAR